MPPRRRQQVQYINWVFTYNNYPNDLSEFDASLRTVAKWAVYQSEIGANGTPHLQGAVRLDVRMRESRLRSLFGDGTPFWKPMRARDPCDAIAYCRKEDTFTGLRFEYGTLPTPAGPPQQGKGSLYKYTAAQLGLLTIADMYDWQRRLLDELTGEPHPRRVRWIWEHVGNTGKTAMAKYLVHYHGAAYVSGKWGDIAYGVTSMADKHPEKKFPTIILIDMPRSLLERCNYAAIEKLKDGMIFAPKYESGQYLFPTPHVVVFANEEPDMASLSADRWSVQQLQAGSLDFSKILVPESDEDEGPTQGYRPNVTESQEEDLLAFLNDD